MSRCSSSTARAAIRRVHLRRRTSRPVCERGGGPLIALPCEKLTIRAGRWATRQAGRARPVDQGTAEQPACGVGGKAAGGICVGAGGWLWLSAGSAGKASTTSDRERQCQLS